jgi:CRP-like cAMP-binding protein
MGKGEEVSGLFEEQGLEVQAYRPSQIAKFIESTKWADTLLAKEVETLSHYLHVYSAEKDTVIVREGRREAYLCLVVEGRVSVMKEGARHAAKRIGTVGAGNTFGEMSLIDGEPRSASVVAEEPTILIVLTGEGFARLSLEVPRLAFKVLLKLSKLLSQRLRQTSGVLVDHLSG